MMFCGVELEQNYLSPLGNSRSKMFPLISETSFRKYSNTSYWSWVHNFASELVVTYILAELIPFTIITMIIIVIITNIIISGLFRYFLHPKFIK